MLLALAVFGGSPSPVSSQVPADSLAGARINVFFDCEGRRCDAGARTFYRTELPWVNWVRDRTDSDIHLIMTSERTGSGGFQFRLDFIGREALVGMEDQLLYGSLSTDVEQEELDGLSTAIGVGIARYASLLGYYDFVEFEGLDVDEGDPQLRLLNAEDVEDRWNLWVFRVGGSGRLNGSETRVTKNLNGNLAASRTTLTWKVFFY